MKSTLKRWLAIVLTAVMVLSMGVPTFSEEESAPKQTTKVEEKAETKSESKSDEKSETKAEPKEEKSETKSEEPAAKTEEKSDDKADETKSEEKPAETASETKDEDSEKTSEDEKGDDETEEPSETKEEEEPSGEEKKDEEGEQGEEEEPEATSEPEAEPTEEPEATEEPEELVAKAVEYKINGKKDIISRLTYNGEEQMLYPKGAKNEITLTIINGENQKTIKNGYLTVKFSVAWTDVDGNSDSEVIVNRVPRFTLPGTYWSTLIVEYDGKEVYHEAKAQKCEIGLASPKVPVLVTKNEDKTLTYNGDDQRLAWYSREAYNVAIGTNRGTVKYKVKYNGNYINDGSALTSNDVVGTNAGEYEVIAWTEYDSNYIIDGDPDDPQKADTRTSVKVTINKAKAALQIETADLPYVGTAYKALDFVTKMTLVTPGEKPEPIFDIEKKENREAVFCDAKGNKDDSTAVDAGEYHIKVAVKKNSASKLLNYDIADLDAVTVKITPAAPERPYTMRVSFALNEDEVDYDADADAYTIKNLVKNVGIYIRDSATQLKLSEDQYTATLYRMVDGDYAEVTEAKDVGNYKVEITPYYEKLPNFAKDSILPFTKDFSIVKQRDVKLQVTMVSEDSTIYYYNAEERKPEEFITGATLIVPGKEEETLELGKQYELDIAKEENSNIKVPTTIKAAGNYVVRVRLIGDYAKNYNVSFTSQWKTITIKPLPVIIKVKGEADNADKAAIGKIYRQDTDKDAIAKNYVPVSGIEGLKLNDAVGELIEGKHPKVETIDDISRVKAVGEYEFKLSIAGKTLMDNDTLSTGSLEITFDATQKYVISPLAITVKAAEDLSKVYGAADDTNAISENYTIEVDEAAKVVGAEKKIKDELRANGGQIVRAPGETAAEDEKSINYPFSYKIGNTTFENGSEAETVGNFTVTFTSDKNFTITRLPVTVTILNALEKEYLTSDDDVAINSNFKIDWDRKTTKATEEDILNGLKASLGTVCRHYVTEDAKNGDKDPVDTYNFYYAGNSLIEDGQEGIVGSNFIVKFNANDKKFTVKPLPVTVTTVLKDADASKNYGVIDPVFADEFEVKHNADTELAGTFNDTTIRNEIKGDEIKGGLIREKAGEADGERVGKYNFYFKTEATTIEPTVAEGESTGKSAETLVGNFVITYQMNHQFEIKAETDVEVSILDATNNSRELTLSLTNGGADASFISPVTASIVVDADMTGVNASITETGKVALEYSAEQIPANASSKKVTVKSIEYSYSIAGKAENWEGGLPAVGNSKLILKLTAKNRDDDDVALSFKNEMSAGEGAETQITNALSGILVAGNDEGKPSGTSVDHGDETFVMNTSATYSYGYSNTIEFKEPLIYSAITTDETLGNTKTKFEKREPRSEGNEASVITSASDWGIVKRKVFSGTDGFTVVTFSHPLGYYTAKTIKLGYDDGVAEGSNATFKTREDNIIVNISGEKLKVAGASGSYELSWADKDLKEGGKVDVTVNWKSSTNNLPSQGSQFTITLEDEVGNTSEIKPTISQSTGSAISIKLTNGKTELTGIDSQLQFSGTAIGFEKIQITVAGHAGDPITISSNSEKWDGVEKPWTATFNIDSLNLPYGVPVEVSVKYLDGMAGGNNTYTFTYDPRTMPVLVTSPMVEGVEVLYGFCEGTVLGNSTQVTYRVVRGNKTVESGVSGSDNNRFMHYDNTAANATYYMFTLQNALQAGDEVTVTYTDKYNTTEEKYTVVSDTSTTAAQPLGVDVISDRSEYGLKKDPRHYFVLPVSLADLRNGDVTVPLMAYAGYDIGTLTVSLDNGCISTVPSFSPYAVSDSDGKVRVALFTSKPSISTLDAVASGSTNVDPGTFSDNDNGTVWIYASFDVKLYKDAVETNHYLPNEYFLVPLTSDSRYWADAIDFAGLDEEAMHDYIDMNSKSYGTFAIAAQTPSNTDI